MSTIKVTNIEHASTGNGGIQLDNAGHVTVDGVQMPSAGPLSNRNIVINGAMQVAQRGTTSSSTNDYCSLDRFRVDANQGAWQFSQESLSSGDPYNLGFRYFARLKNTTVTTANSRRRKFQQYIEAQNVAQSGWNYASSSSYVTFSFWVRSSVAGTYYFALQTQDQSPNKSYVFGETLVADTWTKVEKTIPGASSLVVNNDTGSGLRVIFNVDHGTDFSGSVTLNQWEDFSNTARHPDTSTGWSNTLNATFDVTGVQLEVGEKATPFEHRSYGDELLRCMRYFQKIDGTGSGGARVFGHGATRSANNTHIHVPLGVPMRDKPAFSTVDGSVRITHGGNFSDSSSGSITIGSVTPTVHTDGTNFNVTLNYNGNVGTSIAANQGGVHMMSNQSGTVRFDAEL